LEKPAGAVAGEQRRCDRGCPHDAPGGEMRPAGRLQVHHTVLAEETAETWRLAIMGISDDLHAERPPCSSLWCAVTGLGRARLAVQGSARILREAPRCGTNDSTGGGSRLTFPPLHGPRGPLRTSAGRADLCRFQRRLSWRARVKTFGGESRPLL